MVEVKADQAALCHARIVARSLARRERGTRRERDVVAVRPASAAAHAMLEAAGAGYLRCAASSGSPSHGLQKPCSAQQATG